MRYFLTATANYSVLAMVFAPLVAAGCANVGVPPIPPTFHVIAESAGPIGKTIPVHVKVSCTADCQNRSYFVRRSGVFALKPTGERIAALSIVEAETLSGCDLAQAMHDLVGGGGAGAGVSVGEGASPTLRPPSAPPWTGAQQVQGLAILGALLVAGAPCGVQGNDGKRSVTKGEA